MKNRTLVGFIALGLGLATGCVTSRHDHEHDHKHDHAHGPKCGHQLVNHEGHLDYLHDGHLHTYGSGHSVEHVLSVNASNPATCTPDHDCRDHDDGHKHSAGCEHHAVPHGDHTDYLVNGHLHHNHAGHCDDHGRVIVSE